MSKMIIASAATALILGSSASALAATSAADCQALFEKADINRDGALQSNEASLFLEAMNQAQVRPQDALRVTQSEFTAACQKDAFVSIDAGLSPRKASGSSPPNSGTSTQATGQSTKTVQVEQSLATPEGFMVSNLIGTTVVSQAGENIGEIKDIVLSDKGEATHVIIDAGDKNVEVDKSQLKISANENGLKVVMNGTEADLALLPAVNIDAADQQAAATSSQPGDDTAVKSPQQTAPDQATTEQTIAEQSTSSPEAGKPSLAAPSGVMVSNLIGATVYSQNNENIGGLRDIVLSDKGEATHVIMDVGGMTVEIERSKFSIAATEDGLKVIVNSTQTELAQLPAVNVTAGNQQSATTDAPQTTTEEPSLTSQPVTPDQTAVTERPSTSEQPTVSQSLAAPEGFMVSNLIGATVDSPMEENIGEIKDIVLSDKGEATHVIIDAGGKNIEVERSQLKISATENGLKVVMNSAQADLAKLPAVNIDAKNQQTAAISSQPAQETAATGGKQTISQEQATTQQSTAAEQPAPSDQASAQSIGTGEQPASGEAASGGKADAPQQPTSSAAPAGTTTATVDRPVTGETADAKQPAEKALAIPEGLMVSDLVGATVYSPNDEKLGEINDLALSSAAGQPPQVIIGVGGFFGIGEKDVPVDMSRLKFTSGQDGLRIVLDATKEDLESLAQNSAQ